MSNNLNKIFDKYLKSWAYVITNYDNIDKLKDYIHSHYCYNTNLPNFYSKNVEKSNINLNEISTFNDKQLQFCLVELALLELDEQHRKVLTLRYIHKLNWDFVSFKTNFSRRSCFYMRKDVINKINELQNYFCTYSAPLCTNHNL